MAENKKSFVLYADYKELFMELSDENAGQLIKHIFRYVTDEHPEPENIIVKCSFPIIKAQLKRDLKKWEDLRSRRAEAGRVGGKAKKSKPKQTKQVPLITVSDKEIHTKISKSFYLLKTEYNKIIAEYSPKLVDEKIQAMVNTKGISNRYVSFPKTLVSWIKKDHAPQTESNKSLTTKWGK